MPPLKRKKAPAGSNPAGAVVRALARLLLTGETAKPAVALGIGTVAIDFCVCKGISAVQHARRLVKAILDY